MPIVTLGIDLAKDVFALHGADASGKVVLQRLSVPRGKLLEVVASLPPCLVGLEAARAPATARACSKPTATLLC